MRTKSELESFISTRPGEREILRFLGSDLTLLGEVFSSPTGEFIVVKELPLDQHGQVDFAIFTNRSRMEVVFVEAKGADFSFLNSDKTHSAYVGKATQQIKNRFAYARDNYHKFRKDVLDIWRAVEDGKRPYQAAVGKPVQIDPNKDVHWSGAVIAGHESDELAVSRERSSMESGNSPFIRYHTWQSFIRRLSRA